MTDLIDPPMASIPRDRYKRPLIFPPGGGKPTAYTRCTTYVGCLEDTYNLGRWQQRMVALGLAARPDLVLAAAATTPEDKDTLNTITEQAQEAAKAHAAATTGTALHSLTERIDLGQALGPVPEAYRADLDAYTAATAELEPLLIEPFTVHDGLKIGGTPDRVVMYRGQAYIADVKTGHIDWGAATIAMQLAVYSRSVPYYHQGDGRGGHHGARKPYPEPVDQDRGIIIHLPAGTGTCTLHWTDIAAGWDGVQIAAQVRAWRQRRVLITPWEVDTTPEPESADTLDLRLNHIAALMNAPTLDALRETYSALVASGVDSDAILPTCLARKTELGGDT